MFGEWGFTIGVAAGRPASERIAAAGVPRVDDGWTDAAILAAAFTLPAHLEARRTRLRPTRLADLAIHRYHERAWRRPHAAPGRVAAREAPHRR